MSAPIDRLEDQLLVLACRSGEAEAFRALVTRWQERLWRHAYRLTGREDAAWDVLQESWIAIARGIAKLGDPASFRAWPYRIVTRRAADAARSRRPTGELDEAQAAEPAREPSDGVELLRAALQHVSGERRALLALHYIDGLELRELAEALGIPEGTVKSRMHHAREELRTHIERLDRRQP